jgi:hypothetical protein
MFTQIHIWNVHSSFISNSKKLEIIQLCFLGWVWPNYMHLYHVIQLSNWKKWIIHTQPGWISGEWKRPILKGHTQYDSIYTILKIMEMEISGYKGSQDTGNEDYNKVNKRFLWWQNCSYLECTNINILWYCSFIKCYKPGKLVKSIPHLNVTS